MKSFLILFTFISVVFAVEPTHIEIIQGDTNWSSVQSSPELLARSQNSPFISQTLQEWGHRSHILNLSQGEPVAWRASFLNTAQNSMHILDLGSEWVEDSVICSHSINLYGRSGLCESRSNSQIFDSTLIAKVYWEKGPFSGNAFRMNFARPLTQQGRIGLKILSRNTDSSGHFEYPTSTNQPFLSLGRDSLRMPFTGRNLKLDQSRLIPWLAWDGDYFQTTLWADFLNVDHHESQAEVPIVTANSASLPKNYQRPLFKIQENFSAYGLEFERDLGQFYQTTLQYAYAQSNQSEDQIREQKWILNTDTLKIPTQSEFNSSSHHFEWNLSPQLNQFGLKIHAESEIHFFKDSYTQISAINASGLGSSDVSLYTLGWKDTFYQGLWEAHLGFSRYSSALNKVYFGPNAQITLSQNWKQIHVFAEATQQMRSPTDQETIELKLGRWSIPNRNLTPSQNSNLYLEASSPKFWGQKIKGGFLFNRSLDWIGPGSLLSSPTDTLPISQAFSYQNYEQELLAYAFLGLELNYKNWTSGVSRYQSTLKEVQISQNGSYDPLPQVASVYYKGFLEYKDQILTYKQLGLKFRWDFEWMGPRSDWKIISDQYATPHRLSENLILDADLRIRIQQFELFYKMNNFAHTIQSTQAGYSPPGIQFRWGVDWAFEG